MTIVNQKSFLSGGPVEVRVGDSIGSIDRGKLLFVVILLEGCAVLIAGFAVDVLQFGHEQPVGDIERISLLAFVLYTVFRHTVQGYGIPQIASLKHSIGRIASCWISAWIVLVLFAFAFKSSNQYSRIGAVGFLLFGLFCLTSVNSGISVWIQRRIRQKKFILSRLCVVNFASLATMAEWEPPLGFVVSELVRLPIAVRDDEGIVQSLSERLRENIGASLCDMVVVTAPLHLLEQLHNFVQRLGLLPVPVYLIPTNNEVAILNNRVVRLGSLSALELQRAPLDKFDLLVKRIIDMGLASSALIVLSPLMVLLAIAVLIDSGRPIIFYQDRRGFSGKLFRILKFRSMTVTENGADVSQATRSDARVTTVGRILRRRSLDELPQLINVLKGEMSIVGPRPHALAHDDYYDRILASYAARQHVKPGITGWAQVNGHRGATETPDAMQRRLDYDLWYINNWSLWLDMTIIFRTLTTVLWDENAY